MVARDAGGQRCRNQALLGESLVFGCASTIEKTWKLLHFCSQCIVEFLYLPTLRVFMDHCGEARVLAVCFLATHTRAAVDSPYASSEIMAKCL